MRLTTKGRFAVTAMIDLALHQADGPVVLATIARRQKISLSYLEQLFARLRQNRLVSSMRGPGGGYTVARSLPEVRIGDIIRAVDEPMDATQCGGKGTCLDDGKACMTHELWMGLNDVIYRYLNDITLADMVRQVSQGKRQDTTVALQSHTREEALLQQASA